MTHELTPTHTCTHAMQEHTHGALVYYNLIFFGLQLEVTSLDKLVLMSWYTNLAYGFISIVKNLEIKALAAAYSRRKEREHALGHCKYFPGNTEVLKILETLLRCGNVSDKFQPFCVSS